MYTDLEAYPVVQVALLHLILCVEAAVIEELLQLVVDQSKLERHEHCHASSTLFPDPTPATSLPAGRERRLAIMLP
jgi:hypothetical protein